MPNLKYQVFVSSTYEDLRAERDQVVKAILEMGHIPVGMEMFSAADDDQWNIIARHIEESDYYVVIVAHRYGSTADDGRSFTEREYDHAIASNVPVLGFILADAASWPATRIDKDQKKRNALDRFKTKVRSRYVGFWTSADDLYGKVSLALTKQMTIRPRVGWIRADQGASPEIASELARLSKENAELRVRVSAASPHQQLVDQAAVAWRHFFARVSKYSRVQIWNGDQQNELEADIAESLSHLELDVVGTTTEDLLPAAATMAEQVRKGGIDEAEVSKLRRQVAAVLRGTA